jgi:hypothetical protein
MIRIELDVEVRRFDNAMDAIPWIRELDLAVGQSLQSLRDARLRLGRALLQVKAQVKHGEWTEFYDRVGVNERTAQAVMRVAAAFSDEKGQLNVQAVKDAVARQPNPYRGTDLNLDPARISFTGLRTLSRAPSENRTAVRFSEGANVRVPDIEPDDEEGEDDSDLDDFLAAAPPGAFDTADDDERDALPPPTPPPAAKRLEPLTGQQRGLGEVYALIETSHARQQRLAQRTDTREQFIELLREFDARCAELEGRA